jgi:hypothetical protein
MLSANIWVSASASAFGLELSWTLSWAPVGLLNDVMIIWKNCNTTAWWRAPRSCGTLWSVRQWLNGTYSGNWTEHQGPSAWPPRSPDLTMIGACLCSSAMYYRRCGKTSSSCDNSRRYRECSKYWCTHYRLPWNGRRSVGTPTVNHDFITWWFASIYGEVYADK